MCSTTASAHITILFLKGWGAEQQSQHIDVSQFLVRLGDAKAKGNWPAQGKIHWFVAQESILLWVKFILLLWWAIDVKYQIVYWYRRLISKLFSFVLALTIDLSTVGASDSGGPRQAQRLQGWLWPNPKRWMALRIWTWLSQVTLEAT